MIYNWKYGDFDMPVLRAKDDLAEARIISLIMSNEQREKEPIVSEIGNSYFPELYDEFYD